MYPEIALKAEMLSPIVPFEQARFNDRLESEHEEVWNKFTAAVEASKQSQWSIYLSLWIDEQAPAIYRDRAMLEAITLTSRGGYGYTPEPLKILSKEDYFSKRKFANWLVTLNHHQANLEHKALDEWTLVDFAVQLFDKRLIKTSDFEDILNSVDPVLLNSKNVFGRQDPGDDNWRDVPYRRLPLLYDALLPGEMTGLRGKSYYHWAAKKLHQWTAKQNGADITLPAWLNIENSDELGKNLYAKLCDRPAPDWKIVGPGIERYGWSLLKKGPHIKVDQIAESIADGPTLTQFLRYILIVNNSQRFIGEHYSLYNIPKSLLEQAKGLIPESDTEGFKALQSETEIFNTNEARHKERQKKWEKESRERKAQIKAKEESEQRKQTEAAREAGRLLLLLKNARS